MIHCINQLPSSVIRHVHFFAAAVMETHWSMVSIKSALPRPMATTAWWDIRTFSISCSIRSNLHLLLVAHVEIGSRSHWALYRFTFTRYGWQISRQQTWLSRNRERIAYPTAWGIGLAKKLRNARLLHDGSVEAIIWHDGEAAVSANAVKSMSAADRQSLLLLLESL